MTTRWLWVIVPMLLLGVFLAVEVAQAEPPLINRYLPAMEIREGEKLTIDLQGSDWGPVFEDPDGDDLTYGVSSDGDVLIIVEESLITFLGAPGFVGTECDIVIWAEDTDGERSEYMSLFVTIWGGHGPMPWIRYYEPNTRRVTTPEDEPITFSVSGVENMKTDDWHIVWSVDGFRGVVLETGEFIFPDQADQDAVHNISGTYTVRALVLDDDSLNEYEAGISWEVVVLDVNRPPVFTYLTGDQVLTNGDDVHLQVLAHDPDWDNLSYRWYHSRDFVHVEEIGTSTKMVCSNDIPPGRHQFLCEVSDGNTTVVSEWINVTIVEKGGQKTSCPWYVVIPIMVAVPMILIHWRTEMKGCS